MEIKANTIPCAPQSLDLCESSELTLQAFALRLVEIASRDFAAGRKARRSGRELCDHLCESYRAGHIKMASAIYRKAHWSMTAVAREKEELK